MLRSLTNNIHATKALHNFTVFAPRFYACFNFHINKFIKFIKLKVFKENLYELYKLYELSTIVILIYE